MESEIGGPCQAMDPAELERQIMSWGVPKNEREWWALHEIEQLRSRIEVLEAELGALRKEAAEVVRPFVKTAQMLDEEEYRMDLRLADGASLYDNITAGDCRRALIFLVKLEQNI